MEYSIDTSFLLECWERRYPPDVFPSFWEKLVKPFESSVLVASQAVWVELERKDDEENSIIEWLKPYREV